MVYSQRTMHLWVVAKNGKVVRDWKVSGRRDWPNPGSYRVFSKSATSSSPISHVTFRWMIRFTQGHSLSIGFHSIPRDSQGRPIQTLEQLGHPVVGGGCVRSRDADARWLYDWAGVGTSVVVLG